MGVLVISHTVPQNHYSPSGRLIEQKGDVVVSHGIDTDTMKTVILPCDPFKQFTREHCEFIDGEWYLKEDDAKSA